MERLTVPLLTSELSADGALSSLQGEPGEDDLLPAAGP